MRYLPSPEPPRAARGLSRWASRRNRAGRQRDERDSTAGEIRQGPLQTLAGTWCLPIVARRHEDHVRGWPTHHRLADEGWSQVRCPRTAIHKMALITLTCTSSAG